MNILIIIIACIIFYVIANIIHMYSQRDSNELLMRAVASGSLSVVKECLRQGAYANTADSNNETALMLASKKGFISIAEELIFSGADVNETCSNGNTALMLASKEGPDRKSVV